MAAAKVPGPAPVPHAPGRSRIANCWRAPPQDPFVPTCVSRTGAGEEAPAGYGQKHPIRSRGFGLSGLAEKEEPTLWWVERSASVTVTTVHGSSHSKR